MKQTKIKPWVYAGTVFFLVLLMCISIQAAPKKPPTPSEKTGPIGPKTPRCKWGARVKDEINNEWVWFGGTGGLSKSGGLKTWIFKDGAWKRPEFKPSEEFTQIKKLCLKARNLYAAAANRYYVSETEEAKKVKLDQAYKETASLLKKQKVSDPLTKKLKAEAEAKLSELSVKLSSKVSVKEVAEARHAWMALTKLSWTLSPEPPLRCYSAMAFDKKTGKIVLFGGEGVHGVYNDTWIYDCGKRTWKQVYPETAPSPRLGHGMTAYEGRVYLAGGFKTRGSMSYMTGLWYRLPVDVWEFDIKSSTWTLLKTGEGKKGPTVMQPRVKLNISEDGKKLSWTADLLSWGKKKGEITGSLDLPASDAGTKEAAHPSGTIQVRGLGFDPAWYEDVPPADESAFQAFLKAMPVNKWTNVKAPRGHVQRDWGTTVLDTDRDQLLHWAGGHCAHCGTDVAHFSLATGHWHILYTSELPFEYCYSNSGAPVPAMSGHRPWGTHTYLSYAYDSSTQKMIWAGRHGAYALTNPCGLWMYDPEQYEWSAPQWKIEGGTFDIERHKTCMVSTPHGVCVWACKRGGYCMGGQTGVWMAKVAENVFKPIAANDLNDRKSLPYAAFGDRHGVTYDSKRDRALIMHFGHKQKYKIWAVDLKAKKVTVLEPKGSKNFPMGLSMARDCTYIPDFDLVIVPSRGGKKTPQKTMIYDCAGNEWLEMGSEFSTNKKGRKYPGYGVSSGMEWDSKRKLLWYVDTRGNVYAMRFDHKTAVLKPIHQEKKEVKKAEEETIDE